ncbi:MAG: immunoglobulin domain-containing protein, partial [Verrucomicrobiae bacterium]|nr:immunoglobulin domain-containing protein [Verrucomicrobiae bacterium]
ERGSVAALALQADGRILVGGMFQTLDGEPHANVGRLSADGSVDSTFNPSAKTDVTTLAVQADGRILVGGGFLEFCGAFRRGLGRLNPDGSLDEGYAPETDPLLMTLMVQADGKAIAGTDIFGLFRLQSTDPAENVLTREGPALVWSRGNSGPAVTGAVFDYSNDGETWTLLGEGTPVGTDWRLVGAVVPAGQTARVRGDAQATQSCAAGWTPVEAWLGPPLFLEPPIASTTVDFGSEVILRARVVGTEPISCQWRRDEAPLVDGDGIAGAATATLTLSEVTGASSGLYTVIANNDRGERESQAAQLQVQDPVFAAQPGAVAAMPGEQVRLTATVNGTSPLSYLWHLNGLPLEDGTGFSGTTTPTLTVTVTSPDQVGEYTIEVSNAFATLTSEPARLTVTDPLITNQPEDVATNAGETVVLKVTATAMSPATYQWYLDEEPVTDGDRISGATTDTLTISGVLGAEQGSYALGITSPFGTVRTDSVLVTVVDPVITSEPGDQFVEPGGTASFAVAAAGTEPLAYRWERDGVPLAVDERIGGVTTPVLTLNALTKADAGTYRVVVSNARGAILSRLANLGVGRIEWDPDFSDWANNDVRAVLSLPDGSVLGGGDFTVISDQYRGHLVRYQASGAICADFALGTDGPVYCLSLQADGKVLVGGAFSTLGGEPRQNLARLNADLTLDPEFAPGVVGWVNTLVGEPDGGVLVGGAFDGLGGLPRRNLGRIEPDGTVDPAFDPGPDGAVHTMLLEPAGTLLVGGGFERIGGEPVPYLARLGSNGGVITGFAPAPDAPVRALSLQADGRILTGGDFATVGGFQHYNMARLDPDGSVEDAFNPDLWGGAVYSMIVQSDGRILIAGAFRGVGGASTRHVARLNPDGSRDPAFGLSNITVVWGLALEPDGSLLVAREAQLARLWNNQAASHSLEADGTDLFWRRGGACPTVASAILERSSDGRTWENLSDGLREPGGWRFPDAASAGEGTLRARGALYGGQGNGSHGWAADYAGDVIILGSPLDSTPRAGDDLVLQVTASGSSPLTYLWRRNGEPLEDGNEVSGSRSAVLRIERAFGSHSGTYDVIVANRQGSAASLPAAVNVIDPWVSELPASLRTEAGEDISLESVPHGTGPFSFQWQKDGNRLEGATGAILTLTRPSAEDAGFYQVVVSNSFGEAVSSLSRLDVNAASVRAGLEPGTSGIVHTLALQPDGGILVGGIFDSLGGLQRWGCGRYLPDGAVDPGFSPQVTGVPTSTAWVLAFAVQPDGRTILGGDYLQVGGHPQSHLSRVMSNGVLEAGAFAALPNGAVRSTLQLADGSLIIGGDFDRLGDQARQRLARILPDGTLDPDFAPAADARVFALALDSRGRIVVGGEFATLAGLGRACLGRLNPDGSVDPGFNPGANRAVYSLIVQPDERVLVAGAFTELGGEPRGGVGRLHPDGTLEPGFDAHANDLVYALALQVDGRILLAGRFTWLGGLHRSYLARLLPDGDVDGTFDPGAGHTVYALALRADGQVIVGGRFTTLQGQIRNHLARLSATHPASSILVQDPSRLRWLREGSGPEVWRVVFEHSLDR